MKLCVVGLGYVGLPLAVEASKHFEVIGYDISLNRIARLKSGYDDTNEVDAENLSKSNIEYVNSLEGIEQVDTYIITVPTPVSDGKQPDLRYLEAASREVGGKLRGGECVIYESTVYPGVTEEECIPILEEMSGLKAGSNLSVGYSPERMNPGDKEHTLVNTVKVVSGINQKSLDQVTNIYEKFIKAGVYQAKSVKVAEAAKVIENTQRDLNIALVNELAIIFDRLNINTRDVLDAASTKWNFLAFKPGLVGGHCIGVDPYYLTYKAESVGYHPQVILAGRRINDGMGKYIAQRTVKRIVQRGLDFSQSSIVVLGATFKENCPDMRNSKVQDVVYELENYGIKVEICDPVACPVQMKQKYGNRVVDMQDISLSKAVIVAVEHDNFKTLNFNKVLDKGAVIIDVKSSLDRQLLIDGGFDVWSL